MNHPFSNKQTDWNLRPLVEVAEIRSGLQKSANREKGRIKARYLTVAHVHQNRLELDDERFFHVSKEELNRWRLMPGDVLVVEGNGSPSQVGRTALFQGEIEDCIHQNHIIRVRTNPTLLNPEYLNAYLNSQAGRKEIWRLSSSSTGLHTLSAGRVKELLIPMPPLKTQKQIADMLGSWDRAIETIQTLITKKEIMLAEVTERLVTGRGLPPAKRKSWRMVHFGDLMYESRIPGGTGKDSWKLTVKLYGRGVIEKTETRAGSESTQYYKRKAGQFIYSKLDFLNGAFGIVPPDLDGLESTLDLPAFDLSPDVNPKWFLAYVTRSEFYERAIGYASGGRKARRVNPNAFAKMKLKLPDLEQQDHAVQMIDDFQTEIKTLLDLKEAQIQEKETVLQKILNGGLIK